MITISIAPFNGFSPVIFVLSIPTMNNIPNDKLEEINSETMPRFKKYGNRGINAPKENAKNVRIAPIVGLSGTSNPNSLFIKKSCQIFLSDGQ